jgi:hypothetical protein
VAVQTAREFLRQTLVAVAARAERKVLPKIPSAALRRSLTSRIEETLEGMLAVLSIPHYWAIYLHDGRGPIEKGPTDGFLVFFKNPEEDPRIAGGYPVRASDIRRLTKAQWQEGLRRNRDHLRNGGDIFDVPMIVVKRVGPAQGAFWFTQGMAGFDIEAGAIISARFDAYIQDIIAEPGMTERSTATGIL